MLIFGNKAFELAIEFIGNLTQLTNLNFLLSKIYLVTKVCLTLNMWQRNNFKTWLTIRDKHAYYKQNNPIIFF